MSKFRIGNYRLGKLLGYGSFGVVRLGVNEITNQEVAVKILNKKKLKQMKVKEKIQREIHLCKMFNHPHIVKLFEYFDTKDDIYVVFEYISKGELFELISNKGQLSEDEARKYFHQIIFAIDYAHGFGVAHRDLKPENIMLDSSNNIKIVDFGLSNVMKEGRALKTSCGSPNYAAPEVINGKTYDGCQVDIWSCGVILYAMIFGELPFDEENINTMFKYIKNAKYYMKDVVSIEAKDLINRMIQPDSFKRISISEIKNHPWFKLDIPRYLYEPLKDLKMNGTHKELDQSIVDKLFELKLNINIEDRFEVEEAIKKGELYDFCIAYETLLHSKMMNKINNNLITTSTNLCFKRAPLQKKVTRMLNYCYKVMENFDSEEFENNEDDCFGKLGNLPTRRMKSFNTSRSSAANLRDLLNSEHKKCIGLSFKCNMETLVENAFDVLKEMKIIWKKWNSDYIYKCQTGIPINNSETSISKVEAINESNMIKFFLHFSSISGKKDNHEFEGLKAESLYLVSFIWIKGSTLKYLDFINIFRLKIDDRI